MLRTTRRPLWVLAAAALSVGLVGCSSTAATPTPAPPTTVPATAAAPTPTAAPTAVNYTGRTLKLWHYEAPDSAPGITWTAAIQQFKDTHPGVTVAYENKGFEQIQQTAQMVLSSDQAPDVMELNKGNANAGLLSSEGLLTDLTDVAKTRGWDKLLSPSLQTTCIYNDKGIMGSG